MKKVIVSLMLAVLVGGSTLALTEQTAFAKRSHKVNKATKKKPLHVTKKTTTKTTTSQTKTTTPAPATKPAAATAMPK
jgi:hypothetical protein